METKKVEMTNERVQSGTCSDSAERRGNGTIVQIEIPVGKKIEWVNGVLTLVDEKPKKVTDRIKTFDDALSELGEDHPLVKEYRAITDNVGGLDNDILPYLSDDLISYLRLRIITAALNEGWKPQFIKGERRWYFWYDLITKEQYDKLSAEDKSRVVGRGGFNAVAYSGLVFAVAYHASSYSYSSYGSRLAFKSEELAAYAGRQFAEIYADFCFKPHANESGEKFNSSSPSAAEVAS